MATGPITLLVDPPAQVYYDENGEYVLSWHGPKFIGNPVGFPQDPAHAVAFNMNNDTVPETIHTRHGVFGSGTPLNDWTVTNGTKSSASYGLTQDKFVTSDHFQSDIYGLGGQGFGGSGSFSVLKVVSTGGDVDITTPLVEATNGNAFGTPLWTARALMASDALVDRQVFFIVGGVEQGNYPLIYPPTMLPAGGVTVIHGADSENTIVAAAGAFGVRIKGTTNGEIFYLLQMGSNTIDEVGGIGFWPVAKGGTYPTEFLPDTEAFNPVTIWAGSTGASQASTGESFWWVSVTEDHVPDDTNFVLLARFHEMVRPVNHYGEELGIMNLGRAEAIITFDPTPGMYAEIGVSDEFSFDPLLPRKCVADLYNEDFSIEAGYPEFDHEIDYTGRNFVTYGLTVTPEYTEVHRGTESQSEPWTKAPYRGWLGMELVTPSDPVRFAPGHGRAHFHPSIGAYREMAIASRPLTAGEWAYLADPDGVWSMGMFSQPELATVTGLDAPLYRGDDRAAIVEIQDEDGNPIPLHGLTVWMTYKDQSDNDNDDDAALFKFSAEISPAGAIVAGTGFEIIDALAGTLRAKFTVPAVSVRYDVQVQNIDGDIRTLVTGAFGPTQDVTKRETLP
jgi:hypothetical protein